MSRYAERHFQKQILYPLLKSNGVKAMPDNIYEIYTVETVKALKPRLDIVNLWFDLAMLRRLKRHTTRVPFQPMKEQIS